MSRRGLSSSPPLLLLLALTALAASQPNPLDAQARLNAIWGFGPNDIWAVGDRPVALHWDGQSWTEVPFGVRLSGELKGLWGSGPQNLFAVGQGSTVLLYNGRTWSRMTAPAQADLIAVAGRSATDVYALGMDASDRPVVWRYDGRAWSAVAVPMPFRATGLAVTGSDVLVAGYVTQPQTYGVLGRLTGGQWTFNGWDGRRVTDEALAGGRWSALRAGGSALLLLDLRGGGEDDDEGGEGVPPTIALHAGGAWSLLPAAVSAMGETRVANAFLAADGTPIVMYDDMGFGRFVGGRWMALSSMQILMQPPQMPPGEMTPQQMQAHMMMMQNPLLRAVAYDMGEASAVWSPASTNELYVVTREGRITHVVGDQAVLLYDASCADPMVAGMNPICQVLQMQQMLRAQTPPR